MRLAQRRSTNMGRELEEEVDAAVALVQLRLLKDVALHEARAFSTTLRECLLERVQGHCYNDPRIGRAYRCLRSHRGRHDHVLVAAACLSNTRHILQRLPHTFCMWIDPGCVALRLLDDGHVEERHIGNTRFSIIETASEDELSSAELVDTNLADDIVTSSSTTIGSSTTLPTTTTASSPMTTSPSGFSVTSSSFSPTVSPHERIVSLPPPKPPLDTAAATKAARAAAQAALADAQRAKQQMAKAVRRQSPKPRGRRSRRRRQGEGPWIGSPGYPMAAMPWPGPIGPEQLLAMNAINSFMQQAC
eukprot:m.60278 g.60278  ORF g.60278 m.60278 type:complete len:304 (+) comp13848_c1_seq1:203-1114(+)